MFICTAYIMIVDLWEPTKEKLLHARRVSHTLARHISTPRETFETVIKPRLSLSNIVGASRYKFMNVYDAQDVVGYDEEEKNDGK